MKTENFSKTKIKICGLRRREDILAVNEANPDYCGFIVEFPKSFRSVTADEVRELVKNLSPEIQPVGVFVNASMELVRSLLDDGTLAMAQLHGQEKESYIAELKAHTDKPVIKAFSIKTADDMALSVRSCLNICHRADSDLSPACTVRFFDSSRSQDLSSCREIRSFDDL